MILECVNSTNTQTNFEPVSIYQLKMMYFPKCVLLTPCLHTVTSLTTPRHFNVDFANNMTYSRANWNNYLPFGSLYTFIILRTFYNECALNLFLFKLIWSYVNMILILHLNFLIGRLSRINLIMHYHLKWYRNKLQILYLFIFNLKC